MVKFLNKKCGVIENVVNDELIEMYRNYTDVYEEINENKSTKKDENKSTKKDENKPVDPDAE